jgi:hypothetical protein
VGKIHIVQALQAAYDHLQLIVVGPKNRPETIIIIPKMGQKPLLLSFLLLIPAAFVPVGADVGKVHIVQALHAAYDHLQLIIVRPKKSDRNHYNYHFCSSSLLLIFPVWAVVGKVHIVH